MTTIVTTTSNNYAAIVADQGITSDLMHPDMNKIVQNGTWLVAVCGEDRICDILQYAVKWPVVPEVLTKKKIDDWYPWLVRTLIPRIVKSVQENLNKEFWGTIGDSDAIVVSHGKAFVISETMGITKASPYWAIGSGSHLAMGVLATSSYAPDWNKDADLIAKHSIQTAQMHDPYTRGKITGYKSMGSGKVIPI